MDRNLAAVKLNNGIAPRQVARCPRLVRMFHAPCYHVPTFRGLQDFPFSAVGPILLLREQPLRRRNLVAITGLAEFSGCTHA